MRSKPSQSVIEARVVKRFHRLYAPLLELIQSLQDLTPTGMQLGEKVELTRTDGHIDISFNARPIELVIKDGGRKFSLKVEEQSKKRNT
jgi:hypothetical protein